MREAKEILEKILDAKELAEIESFLNKPLMVEAVKKVLFWRITHQGTLKPGENVDPSLNYLYQLAGSQMAQQGMISNEALGQHLQASFQGMSALLTAFKELESLTKVVEKKEVTKNKAR